GSLKASASNYYLDTRKPTIGSQPQSSYGNRYESMPLVDDYGFQAASTGVGGDSTGVRLFAPVYSGPNGQLYTTSQMFAATGTAQAPVFAPATNNDTATLPTTGFL